MRVMLVVVGILVLAAQQQVCRGHGYMEDPPNRASMWRYGYDTPINYNDNQYFCGGFQVQWEIFKGRCGECGDMFGLPRPRSNENMGKYGRGIVSRRYRAGQEISVNVKVTANHKGWFRFSLCPLASNYSLEKESCFQNNVLQLADGSGTQYMLPHYEPGVFTVKLLLPANLTCQRCVLQWHYNTGNSWGTCIDGSQAVGCGPQETFRSCADIAIDK